MVGLYVPLIKPKYKKIKKVKRRKPIRTDFSSCLPLVLSVKSGKACAFGAANKKKSQMLIVFP